MIKKTFIILVSLLIISCKSENISFEILNPEMFCSKDINTEEHKYDGIGLQNGENRMLVKISNNTANKQILIFDSGNLGRGNTGIVIEDKAGNKKICTADIIEPIGGDIDKDIDYIKSMSTAYGLEIEKFKNYKSKDTPTYLDYKKYKYEILPDEEIQILIVIHLPLIKEEGYDYDGIAPFYCNDISEGDTCSFYYKADAKKYFGALPAEEEEYFKKEGISIYNDTVFTNKVPIRMR